MPDDLVKAAIKRLVDAGLATRQSIRGCTTDELKRLEANCSLRLPSTYKNFLRAMGHDAGDFLVGSDYAYPKLIGFRDSAVRLLSECQSTYTLPSTAFVFLFHQGYSFLFFDVHAGKEDPEVNLFTDSERAPRSVYDSFSTWLHAAIDDDIAAYRELRDV